MKKSMIPANLLYINTKKTLKWLHPIKFIRRHGKMEQNYFQPSLGQLVYFLLVVTLRGVSGTKVTKARET
jgi:hypothetical protein